MKDSATDGTTQITYFIDESGNTGDLTLGGDTLSFGEQPYFGLGCIGVKNIEEFENKISMLKDKHRIRSSDLKSVKIYKGKPKFVLDLIKLIVDQELPFFVELTEKKYFVATNVIFYLALPPYFVDNSDPDLQYTRNLLSEFIALHAPNEVFTNYFKACHTQDKEKLFVAFETLLEFARSGSSMLHTYLADAVVSAMGTFQKVLKQEVSQEETIKRFLPSPDTGKKGKDVWILPNYSSLTSLYARINHAHDGNIEHVKLVHDVQTQFDDILFGAKKAAEDSKPGHKVSPTSNYDFLQTAEMSIKRSEDSLGIQAADVLTGFLVRYAQDKLVYKVEPASELVKAFQLIAETEDLVKGYGVNYVWSHHQRTAGY
ncbi:DUF3800 domain-containing protein [Pseudomonas sp. UV AK001]|uniref:DUF3800 domain-containing protein n=1 Tax=Pseudomonas sp. UV AK001 TaxID=3384791 RepID=UPI0038D41534